ncbi:hypothetical protein [Saccharomonospora glauca]|uniref:hypothetical protein n=1 Tax=Saccharomonospora glauca TaxID=40990 RepID=UPI001E43099E|nr:hypothetical protein [Saccharomonospora glauca]
MTELKDMDLDGGTTRGSGGFLGSVWEKLYGAEGSLSSNAMEKAQKAAGELVASAKNGGFKVTKESANHLIKALQNALSDLDRAEGTLRNFDQRPNLGNHPYGQLVAQHQYEAANGPGSARVAITQLRTVLQLSIEALLHASDQYEEREAEIQHSLRLMAQS